MIGNFVHPVLAGMVVLAGLAAAFMIVIGGISYITSSGNVNKLYRAKRIIVRALIGLIIVIAALAVSLILRQSYGPAMPSGHQQLPSFGSIQPVSQSGGFVDVIIKAISGLLGVIVASAAHPFIVALQYFTSATPLPAANPSVLHLWFICLGLADGLLALVLALIGFHVMGAEQVGLRDVNLSALVPSLILAFILMNASIYLIDGIIELSNAMIVAVRAGMGNVNPWQSLISLTGHSASLGLPALLIFIVFIVLSVILLVYYLARIVILYLGAILSPLVLLLWLLPPFKDFAENAFKTYLTSVFVLFVHVIILLLAGSLFAVVGDSGGVKDPVMSLLLGLTALIALIKTQGVLMQLNYASLGPKTARRLGSSMVNAAMFLGSSAKYVAADLAVPIGGLVSSTRQTLADKGPKLDTKSGAKGKLK